MSKLYSLCFRERNRVKRYELSEAIRVTTKTEFYNIAYYQLLFNFQGFMVDPFSQIAYGICWTRVARFVPYITDH